MLDQSYSAENLRKIFDYENRRGKYLELKYFNDVASVSIEIKAINHDLSEKKKVLSKEDYKAYFLTKDAIKKDLLRKKEDLLGSHLEDISAKLSEGKSDCSLTVVKSKGKDAYKVSDSVDSFFLSKHTQHSIKRLYKVKQSNRIEVLNQLKSVLADQMPKYVVRTDIKDFYESIPTDNLLSKLNADNLLSFSSKVFISKIIKDYQAKSGASKGVPRGVGISAYLAEIYMRDFDRNIKNMKNVIFYSRYVDDIIIVYAQAYPGEVLAPGAMTKKIIEDYGLVQNVLKTKIEETISPFTKPKKIDYLGYSFTFGFLPLKIDLSASRIDKYKSRIDRTIERYLFDSRKSEKKARKIFLKRIRFLSSNIRLVNNKKNVSVGIFYSNSLITTNSSIHYIQNYFQGMLRAYKLRPAIITKIVSKYSFLDGFNKKYMTNFKTSELVAIVALWKYEK